MIGELHAASATHRVLCTGNAAYVRWTTAAFGTLQKRIQVWKAKIVVDHQKILGYEHCGTDWISATKRPFQRTEVLKQVHLCVDFPLACFFDFPLRTWYHSPPCFWLPQNRSENGLESGSDSGSLLELQPGSNPSLQRSVHQPQNSFHFFEDKSWFCN